MICQAISTELRLLRETQTETDRQTDTGSMGHSWYRLKVYDVLLEFEQWDFEVFVGDRVTKSIEIIGKIHDIAISW